MADVRRFADLQAREAWTALGIAMGIAAAALLWLGADTSFSIDESHYYARLVGHGDRLEPYHDLSLGYLFAPHNGHLQVLGRLIYEALFAVFGTAYLPFRIVGVIAVL